MPMIVQRRGGTTKKEADDEHESEFRDGLHIAASPNTGTRNYDANLKIKNSEISELSAYLIYLTNA
jgi:hypothetical protein